jgi:hypothetical protein
MICIGYPQAHEQLEQNEVLNIRGVPKLIFMNICEITLTEQRCLK